jgi:hypothetical protein
MESDLLTMYSNALFYNDANSFVAQEATRQRQCVLLDATAVEFL